MFHRGSPRAQVVVELQGEILHLDAGEVSVDIRIRDVTAQQVSKLGLSKPEAGLVVPERVVPVQPHDLDGHAPDYPGWPGSRNKAGMNLGRYVRT
jgi:hypothetical protein